MDVVHRLNDIAFVWDAEKARANLRKHGVALEVACEVFFDPFVCLLRADVIGGEERELVVGMTRGWQTLAVVYTFRTDRIRLISSRPATSQERRAYEDGSTP
ncbi:MAG: BrnT family toxin [Acidobacteriota bacterium]